MSSTVWEEVFNQQGRFDNHPVARWKSIIKMNTYTHIGSRTLFIDVSHFQLPLPREICPSLCNITILFDSEKCPLYLQHRLFVITYTVDVWIDWAAIVVHTCLLLRIMPVFGTWPREAVSFAGLESLNKLMPLLPVAFILWTVVSYKNYSGIYNNRFRRTNFNPLYSIICLPSRHKCCWRPPVLFSISPIQ